MECGLARSDSGAGALLSIRVRVLLARTVALAFLFTPWATARAEDNPRVIQVPEDSRAEPKETPWAFEPRQGLFGRFVGGVGVTDFQLGPYISSRAVSVAATGSVGYALLPNLILGGELYTALAPEAGLTFNVNGTWTDDTRSGFAGVGPVLIAYAPFDSHASLSVGVTQHSLDADLGGNSSFSVSSKWGLGGQMVLGHDFRLAERMWLGPAAILYYSKNRGDRYYDRRQITTWGVVLGASFSRQ